MPPKANGTTRPQLTHHGRESKSKADTEIQYRSRIVDTDIDCRPRFCGPRFADPVSETPLSMPNMTGRPGYRTMEMNGGSSAPYLAHTPCVPLFLHCLIVVETKNVLDYQGRAGDHFHCPVEPSPGHIRCRL